MLLLPERQMGEAWEPSKKKASLENWGALDRRVLSRVQDSDQRQNRTPWSDDTVEDTQHIVLN
jgi:hypothetical protein